MSIVQFDEPSLRRPAWSVTRGEWFTLADGQRWLLAKPLVVMRSAIEDAEFARTVAEAMLGEEFERVRAGILSIDEEDHAGVIRAVTKLAGLMLMKHYDLPEEATSVLLDPDALPDGVLLAIARVAIGKAPKTFARRRRLTAYLLCGLPGVILEEDLNDLVALPDYLSRSPAASSA